MAPIQNKTSSSTSSSSYSSHKSTSSHDSTPHRDRGGSSLDSSWESFLPVTRRGRFFQDSFFENTRSHFDDAVRDALSRWEDDSDFLSDSWRDSPSPRLSNLSRYRQMRSRNRDEENLAVTVTSDNDVHKIVLDVHDFVDGDLKVKVVGERELLVEGRKGTQKFSRRFTLPEDTDVGAIDSVMSSDGILTITAPKAGRIGSSTSQAEKSSYSSSSSKKLQDTREPCDCDKCNPKLHTRENVHQTNIEQSQCSTSTDNVHPRKVLSEDTRERSEQRENRSDSVKNMNSYSHEEKKKSASNVNINSQDVPIKAFFNSRPITRRGRFFDDSFFEDTRSDYRTAIRDILSKWGEKSSNMDDITSYRNLRTRDLREDNQAVKCVEDEFQHKFVVDVHDFMKEGEINVKAVDDRELVVEGHVEKNQEGGSKSIKRFSRRFLLPDDVHLESVSSVMSSDGVLTIIAPKKTAVTNARETNTPVCNQQINTNSSETYEKECESHMKSSADDHINEKASMMENKCVNDVVYEQASMMDNKCENEDVYGDRCMRGSSTCSLSGPGTSNQEVEEEEKEEAEINGAILQASVSSQVFKAEISEETDVTGGHDISIHVEAADEDQDDNKINSREKRLDADQRCVEEKYTEDLDVDHRSTRRKSMDDFDTNIRCVREKSLESRDRRSGSLRFDQDGEEEEDEAINFQESARHSDVSEKNLRSILKTPDRYYQDDSQRNSRERSYAGEESVDVNRRTPSRDVKRKMAYTPLNLESKRSLPISRRGHFSSDSFFNDFQESYKTAISDVLSKFNEKSNRADDVTDYRNLRLRDPKLENQAYHIQEDQGAHKVVLDVKDFVNGELEASVYGEKELVVEGRAERRSGTSITTLSFLRRFPLPENADTDAITVVMSSDGVLTAVTPWKGFSGLSAIKNILSTEDRPIFDRRSDFDRRWRDEADWRSSPSPSRDDEDDFLTRSRLRSRLRQSNADLF